VVDELSRGESVASEANEGGGTQRKVLHLQSRHQLFPQVFRFVDEYVSKKVEFHNCHPCELGLQRYVQRTVERLQDAIEPDEGEGEPPLVPVLNRYKPMGTTDEVDFKTTRPCWSTNRSQINQVVADTKSWEQSATFRLEQSDDVAFYARNDHLGLTIPYEYYDLDHSYEPDFLVRLTNGLTLVLEIKGEEDDRDRAKHEAAKRWVKAVNNWGQLGQWAFEVCRDPDAVDSVLQAQAGRALVAADRE
jgi:type III restriction enzyme